MSDEIKSEPAPAVRGTERESESWKERGVALRAFLYIFGTHVFAGFIWLLFYLGGHANK
ncbi:DUF6126 family protein [Streptomyces sp. NBC_01089]|nr:DUF6126 family protein [Streptomyces sp. NBC_01089]